MFKILTKWFIKDADNITNARVRTSYGILCGVVGTITNMLLFIIKLIAGLLSNSIAILANGIDNLTDSASSIITLMAFRFSRTPADSEHPYGHQRLEYVAGLIISIVILIIGFTLAKSSIDKIIHPVSIDISRFYLLSGIILFSIILKLWQRIFYIKAARTINSKSLHAAAMDSLSDVLTTTVVLISLFLAKFTSWNIDGYMGLAVSMFIIFNGIKLIRETTSPLLGEAPNEEFVKKVMQKLKSYPGVLGIHDLMIHSYGPAKIYMTVHVEVNAQNDIITSHDLIDRIEMDFYDEFNLNLVIHMDPVDMNDAHTVLAKDIVNDYIKSIDQRLHMHDFRLIQSGKHKAMLFDLVVPNQFTLSDQELKKQVIDLIKKKYKIYTITIIIDHNYLSEE